MDQLERIEALEKRVSAIEAVIRNGRLEFNEDDYEAIVQAVVIGMSKGFEQMAASIADAGKNLDSIAK